jgi:hypothetical protein
VSNKILLLTGHEYRATTGEFAGTMVKLLDVKPKGKEDVYLVDILNGNMAGTKIAMTAGDLKRLFKDQSYEEVG